MLKVVSPESATEPLAGHPAPDRIHLSPPHLTGEEEAFVVDALRSNWVAPLGPHVDAFEREFADAVGAGHGAALSSGTAGLHLALRLAGVEAGDEVFVSSFTFVASANPVLYLGAKPVFIDSEETSWNMDAALLAEALESRARSRRPLPAAVIIVHLYGQTADLDPIVRSCRRWGIPLIEDAAEALGAEYRGRSPGTFGTAGVFSFNGNKIITTSGGGMLVSADEVFVARARKLASQARDRAPWYQHSEAGYNYRMSNLLAGVGRAQLRALGERVAARQAVFGRYQAALSDVPGVTMQPEAPWGKHSRWLTSILIDPREAAADRETLRRALDRENIECRPLWKPLHIQPLFRTCETVGGSVSEGLFRNGLCLPSGSNLGIPDQERIIEVILKVLSR